MDRKIFVKTASIALLAFFASGGACYEVPKIVSSDQMVAAEVFTYYKIQDFNRDNGKCTRRIRAAFSGDNKEYRLTPPARATYKGAEINDESDSDSSKFGCETDKAEFVLFDAQGGAKTDSYELKKAKFKFPPTADRTQDLRIPVEFDEAYKHDFSVTIRTKAPSEPVILRFFEIKDEADLAARLNDPAMAKDLAYFLSEGKLLVIPKTIMAALPAGDAALYIGVEQKLFKPKPDASSSSLESAALTYKYSFDSKLKVK